MAHIRFYSNLASILNSYLIKLSSLASLCVLDFAALTGGGWGDVGFTPTLSLEDSLCFQTGRLLFLFTHKDCFTHDHNCFSD